MLFVLQRAYVLGQMAKNFESARIEILKTHAIDTRICIQMENKTAFTKKSNLFAFFLWTVYA